MQSLHRPLRQHCLSKLRERSDVAACSGQPTAHPATVELGESCHGKTATAVSLPQWPMLAAWAHASTHLHPTAGTRPGTHRWPGRHRTHRLPLWRSCRCPGQGLGMQAVEVAGWGRRRQAARHGSAVGQSWLKHSSNALPTARTHLHDLLQLVVDLRGRMNSSGLSVALALASHALAGNAARTPSCSPLHATTSSPLGSAPSPAH